MNTLKQVVRPVRFFIIVQSVTSNINPLSRRSVTDMDAHVTVSRLTQQIVHHLQRKDVHVNIRL